MGTQRVQMKGPFLGRFIVLVMLVQDFYPALAALVRKVPQPGQAAVQGRLSPRTRIEHLESGQEIGWDWEHEKHRRIREQNQ